MSQINSRDKVFLWRGEYQCGEIEDLVTGVYGLRVWVYVRLCYR